MLTRLQYQAGSTLRNLYLAIKAVVTGTTDKTTLPSDIVQGSSYIRTTAAVAGWEAFDLNVYDVLMPNTMTGLPAAANVSKSLIYSTTLSKWLWSYVGASNSYVVSSADLTAWTTELTVTGTAGLVIADNGVLVVALESSGSTVAHHNTGSGWTNVTQIGAAWSSVSALPSGNFCAVSNTTATSAMFFNGSVWASCTRSSGTVTDITNDGTQFLLVGTNLCSTSPTGQTWATQTITAGSWLKAVWDGTKFCALGANITTNSPTGVTWSAGVYVGLGSNICYDSTNAKLVSLVSTTQIGFSADHGATWNYRTIGVSITVINALVASSGEITSLTITQSFKFKFNYLSCGLKALCDDGVSYKYAILDMGLGNNTYIQLRCYQSITGYTYANMSSSTDNTNHQRLDLVSGGYLYIGASNYYLAMFSYMSGDIWGSSAGATPCGIYEYTRDDPANKPPYSTWGFQYSTSFGLYCPIVRTSTTADSVVISLPEVSDFPLKKIIAANGISEEHPLRSVRVGTSTANNTIMGGTLLGGIYRTTDSFGATGDLMDVTGTDSHMVIKMGAAANRYLIPNG